MTGSDRRVDPPQGPPWPVDVLADLHAGALDDTVSAELWPRVRHDPDASAVLAALDATRAELAGLGTTTVPLPDRFVTRLDDALAAEAGAAFSGRAQPQAPAPEPAPVADLAAARRRRNHLRGWSAGLAVAAAAVAVVVLALPHRGPAVSGVAAAPPHPLTSGQLGTATVASALGRTDYGPLTDPGRRAACLAANGVTDQRPAGALQVTLNGKPGTLIVLPTGRTAQFRLLVVGPGCAAGKADELADTVVGGLPAPTR